MDFKKVVDDLLEIKSYFELEENNIKNGIIPYSMNEKLNHFRSIMKGNIESLENELHSKDK